MLPCSVGFAVPTGLETRLVCRTSLKLFCSLCFHCIETSVPSASPQRGNTTSPCQPDKATPLLGRYKSSSVHTGRELLRRQPGLQGLIVCLLPWPFCDDFCVSQLRTLGFLQARASVLRAPKLSPRARCQRVVWYPWKLAAWWCWLRRTK